MFTKSMNIKDFLKKENNNLDFIRILCASLVIVGHSYRLDGVVGGRDFISMLTGFTYSGAIAVKIFFFISGLLVTDSILKRQSVPTFIISRFFRMMPGLLFLLLITSFIIGPILTDLQLSSYFKNSDTYKYVVSNLLFITDYTLPGVFGKNNMRYTVNGSLWSLRLEVRCYAALLFLFIFFKTRKPLYNFVILFVIIDAIFQLKIIGRGENTEHSLLPFSFALGSLLAVNKELIKLNNWIGIGLLVMATLLWHTPYNELGFIVCVCYWLLLVSKNKYINKLRIKYDISYGIYLWGFLVQQIIYYLMGSQNIYLYMVESIFVSAILGYFSYILVEKKFMEIGKRLSKKLEAKPNPTPIIKAE